MFIRVGGPPLYLFVGLLQLFIRRILDGGKMIVRLVQCQNELGELDLQRQRVPVLRGTVGRGGPRRREWKRPGGTATGFPVHAAVALAIRENQLPWSLWEAVPNDSIGRPARM